MFYITGDTHGLYDIGKLHKIKKTINKEDYLIILGDVALYWYGNENDNTVRDLLNEIKGTVLWIDGNHENFDLIDKLPITEWNGGLVQKTNHKMIHLMRGEVYCIEGKTFFTFGGGHSIDKMRRVEGHSWWPREMPNTEEMNNGLNNLRAYNYNVDYVLTHTAPANVCKKLVSDIYPGEEKLQNYFSHIDKKVNYDQWFFGHWHMDKELNKFRALYQDIISL